jgi:hypothetical protein
MFVGAWRNISTVSKGLYNCTIKQLLKSVLHDIQELSRVWSILCVPNPITNHYFSAINMKRLQRSNFIVTCMLLGNENWIWTVLKMKIEIVRKYTTVKYDWCNNIYVYIRGHVHIHVATQNVRLTFWVGGKFSNGVTFLPWQCKNFVRTYVFVGFLYFYFYMLTVSFRRN